MTDGPGSTASTPGRNATTNLRAVLLWSYDALDAEAREMFRLLGGYPGDEISVPAAAALADTDSADAARLCSALSQANCCTPSSRRVTGTRGNGPPAVVAGAYRRQRPPTVGPDRRGDAEPAAARAGERDDVLRVCRRAGLVRSRTTHPGGRHPGEGGPAAARHLGDREAELKFVGLSHAYHVLERTDETASLLEKVLATSRELGRDEDSARALVNLTLANQSTGRLTESIAAGEEALALATRLGLRKLEASALNNLAMSYVLVGMTDRAAEHSRTAIDIYGRLGDRPRVAQALDTLGLAYAGGGQPQRAVESFDEAIELATTLQMRRSEANALLNRCRALSDLGRDREARASRERARHLLTELGNPAIDTPGTRRAPSA